MENCIFCKIARKEIDKDFIYEDDDVMVFPDLKPVRPVHLLIIPKAHSKELQAVTNPALFERLGSVIQKMIAVMQLENRGYRIVINGGGAQVVDHLHVHLMGPIGSDQSV